MPKFLTWAPRMKVAINRDAYGAVLGHVQLSHAKLTYADAVVKEGADMLGEASSMEMQVFL